MVDQRLTKYWQHAARLLGIRVTAPFNLSLGVLSIPVAACVPDFGAERGMLLVSDFASIEPHLPAICAAGYGYSVLSAGTSGPMRAELIELLADWGWSGPGSEPKWLSEA
jgi:hypothetical protein